MARVALCMIIKCTEDELPHLEKCLKNIHKHVDGIFLTLTHAKGEQIPNKFRNLARKYRAHTTDYVWKDHFAAARNFSFAQVPKDYEFTLWLDSDDTVENPEKIKDTVSVMPKGVSAVYACYDYAHDEYGNVTVPHYVARLVRNDGTYAWKSSFDDEDYSVHETLAEVRGTGRRMTEEWKVVHHASGTRTLASQYRNIKLLEGMFKKQSKKGKVDPRILFYLGTHLYDGRRFLEAKDLLQKYMQLSGWADERSEALVTLGQILDLENKPMQAKQAYVLAISESPNNPRPYTEIADLCLKGKRPSEAAEWAMKAIECKKQVTAMAIRPMDATFRPFVIYAKAQAERGGEHLQDAMVYIAKALKLRPADPEALELQEQLENLIEIRDLNRAYARLLKAIGDDKVKTGKLLEATPEKLLNSPLVAQVRSEFTPPRKWPRKSMAIYCGASVIESWGPNSLKDGIGGSEEAVIRLKTELEKLGWEVHVYATPGKEVSDTWHHYWEFNPNDKFDVIVAWRMPWFFDTEISARKKYLWMHDVMPENEFTQERLDNLDKVILLSKYHRSIFPKIPDDKVFLSSNGITPEDFRVYERSLIPQSIIDINLENTKKQEKLGNGSVEEWLDHEARKFNKYGENRRDPHRLIYMSSHVRGLQLVYDMWPDIKKAVPDAKLDIYYGWGSFINVQKNNPERMIWMEEMKSQEQLLEGVTDHGKISQDQIVREIFSSGVWVYPCPFPEISCITALKAQAGGAVPVSSNFAALDETVQFGIKIPMKAMDEDAPVGKWDRRDIERFKQSLIDMLKKPDLQEKIRPQMMKWARQQSWANVAERWIEEFDED